MDREEKIIQDKIIFWLINQKLKGFNFIDFSECAEKICLNINNNNHKKLIDRSINLFNKNIKNKIINYYEENN